MIEIISREEAEVILPKNIRQVGSPGGRHKIYMEDYVYAYLKALASEQRKCGAVLLGKSSVMKEVRYTFISGAVECAQAMFQFDDICLDESFWEYIDMEEKEYFPETVVVGWFVGVQGSGAELPTVIEAAHRKYFAGRDKVLLRMDVKEEEELFYIYEQGYLQKREGYYIYYEKNTGMQKYMARKKEEQHSLTEELPAEQKIFVKSSMEEPISEAEQALQNYRTMMLEKRESKVERHNKRFLYAAASFCMIALCIVGITTINNYNKMKEMEEVLHIMKVSETEVPAKEEEAEIIVKNLASEVSLQQENAQPGTVLSDTVQLDTVQPESTQPEEAQPEQQVDEPQVPAEPQYYIVQAGDTLESICRNLYQNKAMIAELCRINGIEDGNQIKAGQKLLLP